MNFETPKQEPTINEFMQHFSAMKAKWQAEGNVDSEFDDANKLQKQVEDGEITARDGIARLQGMDDARIER